MIMIIIIATMTAIILILQIHLSHHCLSTASVYEASPSNSALSSWSHDLPIFYGIGRIWYRKKSLGLVSVLDRSRDF